MRKAVIALATMALLFAVGVGIVSAQYASPSSAMSPPATPRATTTMPSGAPNTGHAN